MAREHYPVVIADLRISMLDTQPFAFASVHNSDILNIPPREHSTITSFPERREVYHVNLQPKDCREGRKGIYSAISCVGVR